MNKRRDSMMIWVIGERLSNTIDMKELHLEIGA